MKNKKKILWKSLFIAKSAYIITNRKEVMLNYFKHVIQIDMKVLDVYLNENCRPPDILEAADLAVANLLQKIQNK